MSLSGKYSKIYKLFNDLTEELTILLTKANFENVCKVVNTLYDMEPRLLVKALLVIKKINREQLLHSENRYAKVYFKELIRLLNSKNHLDNGDSHPIGQDMSINSCADKSQNVLNVKRLKTNDSETSAKKNTSALQYVMGDLKLKNEKIQPIIKDNTLHKYEITWFRLILTGDLKTSLKGLYDEFPTFSSYLHDIHILAEEFNIVEVYYKKKAKIAPLMNLFNESSYVEEIIFCSELEKVKKLKIRPCDSFSNMIKFYFCCKTKSFTFTITSCEDMKVFHYVYLMCSVFMHASKFTASNTTVSPAPLAGISYSKPMVTSVPKTKMVEDITPFETTYVEEHGLDNIHNTSATLESYRIKKRHKMYALTQDREKRMVQGISAIGGANQSEIVITPTKELKRKRIELLKSLSNKKLKSE
ncbi:P47 [Callinectes sapidus nudivirus]|nr:P47 [Callinectes sapidus nudivirus]